MERIRVFLENLPTKVRKDDILKEFSVYGKIVKVYLIYDQPGTGFVDFMDPADAEFAATSMDDTEFLGQRLKIKLTRGSTDVRNGTSGRSGHFESSSSRDSTHFRDGGFRDRERRSSSGYDVVRSGGRFESFRGRGSRGMAGDFRDTNRDSRHSSAFSDSRRARGSFGFRDSGGSGFRDSGGAGFRDSGSSSFRDSGNSGFRSARGFSFRDSRNASDFRESGGSFGFGESRESNYGSRGRGFKGSRSMSGYGQGFSSSRGGMRGAFSKDFRGSSRSHYSNDHRNDYCDFDDGSYPSYSHNNDYENDIDQYAASVRHSNNRRSYRETHRNSHVSAAYDSENFYTSSRRTDRSRSPFSRGSDSREVRHSKPYEVKSESAIKRTFKNRDPDYAGHRHRPDSSGRVDELYSRGEKRRNTTKERF